MNDSQDPAERVARIAAGQGTRIAVTESLTGGLISSRLAAAPDASRWFAGAIVAYASDVKHELLRVPDGPVVSGQAATAMARSAGRLLRADLTLAITGVGGPARQDDEPPGTVWVCVWTGRRSQVQHWHIDADGPAEICRHAATRALMLLADHLATETRQ